MSENNTMDISTDEKADALLNQLMRLKSYETPEAARMTRNKQNIMRQVRQAQSEQRKPLLDRLEISMPWLFAEPKYGIAALFIAFIGLQYAGINARNSTTSTGIYTTTSSLASYEAVANIQSNRYPNLPRDYQLFGQPQGDQTVVPAGFEFKK